MTIERILGETSAGPLLGGLSWRPPSGGQHSMRRLHEARHLTSDATHYSLFQSPKATVYGLYQPRASEELMRLPKGVLSAAHRFASRVGESAPNAALLLTLSAGGQRRQERVYVVVLEDGVPVVDSLTTDMEARNALGSEDRPIWADNPLLYPNCHAVDLEWLAHGAGKSARVLPIPVNPWPWLLLALLVLAAAGSWWLLRSARQAESHRQLAAEAAARDPVPKYLAALAAEAPTMSSERSQLVEAVRALFDMQVRTPGWALSSVQCAMKTLRCSALWLRKGGSFEDLARARPHDRLEPVTSEAGGVPLWDAARTEWPLSVQRKPLATALSDLPGQARAWREAGPLWQSWKTAGIAVDVKPALLWPQADGVPPEFRHAAALRRGELGLAGVPGPFVIEALQTAPAWVSWESVGAELGEGDLKARLKFNASGVYYASAN